MKAHELEFTGALIERGFWLYVWHVCEGDSSIVYVGRTGDSSSLNAASPFNRLGQHLDVRPKAAANMLLRHMQARGIDPIAARYRLVAVGPIFPEQSTWNAHQAHRDRVAAMEAALARHMLERGHDVVGNTTSKHKADPALLSQVLHKFKAPLDALPIRDTTQSSVAAMTHRSSD